MPIKPKTNVQCYIYDKFNERGMKIFEKRVRLILRRADIFGDVICHNSYMKRGNGRGSYYQCAEIEINREIYTLAEHTHDSELWDNWENPTTQDKRNLFLAVLHNQAQTLKEIITENSELCDQTK
jgi:hypothetical protein